MAHRTIHALAIAGLICAYQFVYAILVLVWAALGSARHE